LPDDSVKDFLLHHKDFREESVLKPENLLREARRQKKLPPGPVPAICVLDPDGDIAAYLVKRRAATRCRPWACYHTRLYVSRIRRVPVGFVPGAVGAPFVVLAAEQLRVSGCRFLLSITSAGRLSPVPEEYVLITRALRDEGSSYHYLPAGREARLAATAAKIVAPLVKVKNLSLTAGVSWTTDAPYRETKSALDAAKKRLAVAVEMEAAALYAFSQAKDFPVACFAHLTNTMAQTQGDFQKGQYSGALTSLRLVSALVHQLQLNGFTNLLKGRGL
jgi:uridine phosphorylase